MLSLSWNIFRSIFYIVLSLLLYSQHACGLEYTVEMIEDKTAKQSIDDIISDQTIFETKALTSRNFGFTKSSFWLRVKYQLPRIAPHNYLLVNPVALIENFIVYDAQGKMLKNLGTRGDPATFDFGPSIRAMPIAKQEGVMYVNIFSQTTIQIKLAIEPANQFFLEEQISNFFKILYCGALLSLALYNFFLAFVLRTSSYYFYVATVVSFVIFQFSQNGNLVWLNPAFDEGLNLFSIPFFASIFYLFGLIFTYKFLSGSMFHPIVKFLFWIGVLGAVVLSSGSFYFDYEFLMPLVVLFSFLQVVILLVMAFNGIKLGRHQAPYFLAAWSFYFAGLVIIGLRNFALIPSNIFVDYSLQIGSTCEAFFLSFALAHRIRTAEQARSSLMLEKSYIEQNLQHEKFIVQTNQMLAHDLKAPIHIFERLLLTTKEEFDDQKPMIKEALFRTMSMINALKRGETDFSLKRSQQTMSFKMAENILLGKAVKNGIDLVFDFEAIKGYKFNLDYSKVERCLINLVQNALEAASKKVIIRAEVTQQDLVIQVIDDGPGVPFEVHPKLFEAGATFGKLDGSGLGLAYVKQVMQAHGGDIVYSREHDLTKFKCRLPRVLASRPSRGTCSEISDELIKPVDKKLIAVKFASEIVTDALVSCLESYGYQGIIVTKNLRDDYDVLVTDIISVFEQQADSGSRVIFLPENMNENDLIKKVPLRLGLQTCDVGGGGRNGSVGKDRPTLSGGQFI